MPIQHPTQIELSPEETSRIEGEYRINPELDEARGLLRLAVLEKISKTTDDPVLQSAAAKTTANLKAIQAGQPATDFFEQAA